MNLRNRTSGAILSAILVAALVSSGYLFSGALATSSTTISAGTGQGTIVFHAHRVASTDWAPCFALTCDAGTGPGASMYFLVYNSSGVIVAKGFADETGTSVTGLTAGATYGVYPADCDLCHNSTHNVVFDHWGDGSTARPLEVTAQSTSAISLDAFYKIVELGSVPTPAQASSTPSQPTTASTSSGQLQPIGTAQTPIQSVIATEKSGTVQLTITTTGTHATTQHIVIGQPHNAQALQHGLKLGLLKHKLAKLGFSGFLGNNQDKHDGDN